MDYFDILLAKKLSGGGGGDIDVESLTATENRTYNAGTGKAYNPVVVAVPEPTLIAKNISQNGTYNASDDNADGYSSVTVDVKGYQIKNIANVPTDIASFTDGTDLPMLKLEVGIEAVQSGSGDPSPENVRPISGWDSVSCVTDGSCVDTLTPLYNVTYYSLYFSKATVQAEPNMDYYVNSNSPNALIQSQTLETTFIVCPEEDTPTTVDFGVVNGEELHIKTKSSGVIAIYYRIRKGSSGIIQLTTPQDFKDGTYYLQITKTSTNNQRLGATYTIQLGDTYYGGKLDVTSGVLTVDRASIDLGDLSWGSYSSDTTEHSFVVNVPAYIKDVVSTNDIADLLTEIYGVTNFQNVTLWQAKNEKICQVNSPQRFIIRDENYNDATAFQSSVTGKKMIYELKTPLVVQLTPTQVKSLLKDNNIWADSGQIISGQYFAEL